jgi:hypothetical protein
MLKIFNFLKKETGEVKLVTMRERFEAVQSEMNAVLENMSEMPVITVDATARRIEMAMPEYFADEALALPAPDKEETASQDATTSKPDTEDASSGNSGEKDNNDTAKPAA